ncbi:MAG: hypothetical protein R3A79_24555 [Nannocystaceae bacterium]
MPGRRTWTRRIDRAGALLCAASIVLLTSGAHAAPGPNPGDPPDPGLRGPEEPPDPSKPDADAVDDADTEATPDAATPDDATPNDATASDATPDDSSSTGALPTAGGDTPPPPTDLQEAPLAPRPRHRWIYTNLIGARYNPLGLINDLTIGYRYQLINKDSILFNESFIAAQAHVIATPAYAGGGPKLDIQPAAVLNLSASYDVLGFFGAFGSLQSFPSATSEWSDTRIGELADMDLNYAALAHMVTLSGLLQGKVKNIAFRDNIKFYWSDYDLRDGDRVFYSQTLDMLLPDRGWAMTNDLDLLYLFDFGLTLGARYTATRAFFTEQHFAPGEEPVSVFAPTHRLGPALIYTFNKRADKRFNEPSLIVLPQWWIRHPYRTGQDVHGAIPYFVVAFTFKGDLYPDPALWNAKSEPLRGKRARAK